MNPSLSQSDITNSIESLEDAEVVANIEFPPGQCLQRGHLLCSTTSLSRRGVSLTERISIFEEGICENAYAQVKQTTEIGHYESVI